MELSSKGKWDLLSSPFKLGNVDLKNRIVFQPHFTSFGNEDGSPSETHRAYYEERAAGGTGLIIFESQATHPNGRISRYATNAWDECNIKSYSNVVNAVHNHGTKIFSQLTHSGPDTLMIRPSILWGPSQLDESPTTFRTKKMEIADIEDVISHFAQSARNMVEAGFDGIEIKIGHDGLLRAFASPFLNTRLDQYGQNFDGRMRISLEVIAAVRKEIPSEMPLGIRLCVSEFTEWGYDADYGIAMAKEIEKSTHINYFNADAGTAANYWMQIPPASFDEGSFRHITKKLKSNVEIPVISFGRIKHPEQAESILKSGEADLIGMARQLIADPSYAKKVLEGKDDEIRYCIGGNDSCIFQVANEQPLRCDHNPSAGRELIFSERLITKARTVKNIAIVGAGPAGLKVAEILALRGHAVTVFEKDNNVGGQVLLAQLQPYHVEIYDVIDYLKRATSKLGVEIHLGVEITSDLLEEIDAEVIVLATGSSPISYRHSDELSDKSEMPGSYRNVIQNIDCETVATSDEILSGSKNPGKNVLLIDEMGSWDGAGTAEFLANAGSQVHVISSHFSIGSSLETANQVLFYKRALEKGISLLPSTKLLKITGNNAYLENIHSKMGFQIMDVDQIAVSVGRRSEDSLYVNWAEALTSKQIFRIGDSVAPRMLRDVLREAYDFAVHFE
jgi:2,4-dienoyl-CoA reductase-like NADH-dependent reductase (Old Yellow Enzyme family)/pyruvate/2-oxoglutarate dehydrogenase complex dihydrolipoamide dehydrogenase (E3) component